MKRIVIFILLLVGFLFVLKTGGQKFLDEHSKRSFIQLSEQRARAIFYALEKSGTQLTVDYQEAICMWYRGKILLRDRDELKYAHVEFEDWLRKMKLYRKISSFEIVGTEYAELKEGRAVFVDCTIEGRPVRFVSEEEKPLRQVKAGRVNTGVH